MSYLGREAAENGIPEVTQCTGEVLVEEISQKFAHSEVRPSAVDEEETFKITELRHRKVTGQNGLHTFLTTNADTNVSRCIAYTRYDTILVLSI